MHCIKTGFFTLFYQRRTTAVFFRLKCKLQYNHYYSDQLPIYSGQSSVICQCVTKPRLSFQTLNRATVCSVAGPDRCFGHCQPGDTERETIDGLGNRVDCCGTHDMRLWTGAIVITLLGVAGLASHDSFCQTVCQHCQ